MRRLSALDAQFLAAERGNFGAHYCGLAVYQTRRGKPITAAKIRRLISERIGECPPLRWKLVTVPLGLDHPVFVETEIDLDDHVSETTLAAPARRSRRETFMVTSSTVPGGGVIVAPIRRTRLEVRRLLAVPPGGPWRSQNFSNPHEKSAEQGLPPRSD